jgi:hypothetical protein
MKITFYGAAENVTGSKHLIGFFWIVAFIKGGGKNRSR